MKLGIANRLTVEDADLADTIDVTPRYADVAYLLQLEEHAADELAQSWLDVINDGKKVA